MALLGLMSVTAFAANPDVTAIAARVKANPAEYQSLLRRFESGDQSLTPEQVAFVYYGAPAGGAAPSKADLGKINDLRSQRRYAEMLPLCQEALKTHPVELTLLFRAFAAGANTGNPAVQSNAQVRVNQLCDAIFASGKGVTEVEPFIVVSEADVEQFLNNYIQVDRILGIARQGKLIVSQVELPGRQEPAYLYFLPVGN